MKHPSHEEWAPYVFGETDTETRAALKKHLQECPDCREEIDCWQRTLKRLDKWHVPPPRVTRQARWASPLLKLAALAAFFIGIGYAAGRFEKSMRAAIASEVRQKVREDLAGEVSNALARAEDRTVGQWSAERERVTAFAAEIVRRETSRQMGELIQLLNNAREEDKRVTLALFQQTQDQRVADYLSLRKDLETLASFTDDEVRHARERLIQLAAVTGK